jgi:outer membrane protein
MKQTEVIAVAVLLGSAAMTTTSAMAYDDVFGVADSGSNSFVGLGVSYKPDYEGSDDSEAMIAPFGRYNWASGRYVSLGRTGGSESAGRLKLNLLSKGDNGMFELGPLLQYRLKRDNDVDNKQVSRMEDVDAATEAGAFVGIKSGNWSGDVSFATDVSNEHDGSLVYVNGGYRIPVNDKFEMKLGAHVTWADSDYMDTYFGVSSRDSASSGLKSYSASSGLKDAGISVAGHYKFTKAWGVAGNLGYTRMLSDAKDSPVVDDAGDETQIVSEAALTYTF